MSPIGIVATAWTAVTATTLSVLTVAYHVGVRRERRAALRLVPAASAPRQRHLYLVR